MIIAVVGFGLVYPWRSVDNSLEVAGVQALVDEMAEAHFSIVNGEKGVADFTIANDAFEGMVTTTPSGIPALGLIGASGDDCFIMHWTAPETAQVGRLPGDWPCSPTSIASIPLSDHDGYVAGTGPPFDVTPLIREARTPIWFVVAVTALTLLALKAGSDLFLILVRPDHFLSER